jgi:hypothetical protein
MTAPYFLLRQVALVETAFAMPMKYSSQPGLSFFPFFTESLQRKYFNKVHEQLIW